MNTPYVKSYNEQGILTNPIDKLYLNQFPNRAARRQAKNETPFRGNGKNYPLTVIGNVRYLRAVQVIHQKDGSVKRINHYVPCGAVKKAA